MIINSKLECQRNELIEQANKVHNNRYDYSLMESTGKIRTIICKRHGIFKQNIRQHIKLGVGCPKCIDVPSGSSYEEILNNLFDNQLKYIENVDYFRTDRIIIKPHEIDFYFPDKKLGIEFNGDYYHSDFMKNTHLYHRTKKLTGIENNINIIMIYEHEWNSHQEIIINKLINYLTAYSIKDFNDIRELSEEEAKKFIQLNSLNKINGNINIGLYEHNTLISLLSINKIENNYFNIINFCSSKLNYIPLKYLFDYFVKKYSPQKIIVEEDLDWSNENEYKDLGFIVSHLSNNFNTVWVKGIHIITEENIYDNIKEDGYLKISKCGSMILEWTNNKRKLTWITD